MNPLTNHPETWKYAIVGLQTARRIFVNDPYDPYVGSNNEL